MFDKIKNAVKGAFETAVRWAGNAIANIRRWAESPVALGFGVFAGSTMFIGSALGTLIVGAPVVSVVLVSLLIGAIGFFGALAIVGSVVDDITAQGDEITFSGLKSA